jgi:TIR domain
MTGGAKWEKEIEDKLRACDIFILLVSASSMASDYIIDKEIAIIRERQAQGESVHFYPLLLTPTPKAGLNKVKDLNLRPRDAKPFSRRTRTHCERQESRPADHIGQTAPIHPHHRSTRHGLRAPRWPRRRVEAPR